jgi:hypothetical protein
VSLPRAFALGCFVASARGGCLHVARGRAVVRTDCVARTTTSMMFFLFHNCKEAFKHVTCTGVSHCCDYPSHRLADTSSPSLACCYEAYAIYTYEPLLMSLTRDCRGADMWAPSSTASATFDPHLRRLLCFAPTAMRTPRPSISCRLNWLSDLEKSV